MKCDHDVAGNDSLLRITPSSQGGFHHDTAPLDEILPCPKQLIRGNVEPSAWRFRR
jgi:hypothetical protein